MNNRFLRTYPLRLYSEYIRNFNSRGLVRQLFTNLDDQQANFLIFRNSCETY